MFILIITLTDRYPDIETLNYRCLKEAESPQSRPERLGVPKSPSGRRGNELHTGKCMVIQSVPLGLVNKALLTVRDTDDDSYPQRRTMLERLKSGELTAPIQVQDSNALGSSEPESDTELLKQAVGTFIFRQAKVTHGQSSPHPPHSGAAAELELRHTRGKDSLVVDVVSRGDPALTDKSIDHFLHVLTHALDKVAAGCELDARSRYPEKHRQFNTKFREETVRAACERFGDRFVLRDPEDKSESENIWSLKKNNKYTTITSPNGSKQRLDNCAYNANGEPDDEILTQSAIQTAKYLRDRRAGDDVNLTLEEIQRLEGAISIFGSCDMVPLERMNFTDLKNAVPVWSVSDEGNARS
jgi:hypothetical protein